MLELALVLTSNRGFSSVDCFNKQQDVCGTHAFCWLSENSTSAAWQKGNTSKWHGRQVVTEHIVTHLTAFQHPQMSQSSPAADRKAGQTHTFKAPSTYPSRAEACPKQVSGKPNQPCTEAGHILVSRNHPVKHFLLPTSPS